VVDHVVVLQVLGGSRIDHPAEDRDGRARAHAGIPVGAHLDGARRARVAGEQRELDLGARAMARDADLLPAIERDPHGRARGTRELDRRDSLGCQVLLCAEPSAHVLGDQVHLLGGQAEALGDPLRDQARSLRRNVNVQRLALPAGDAGVRLEGGVDLRRRAPAPLHKQRVAALPRLGDQSTRLAAPLRKGPRRPAYVPVPAGRRRRSLP